MTAHLRALAETINPESAECGKNERYDTAGKLLTFHSTHSSIRPGRITKSSDAKIGDDKRGNKMEQLIAQIVGGALGGAGGGKAVSGSSMGGLGNMLAGAAGGLGGGSLLGGLMGSGAEAAAGGLDIASIAGNLVGGGVSGLVVQVVLGMIIKKFRG
jgi:hypothetical protein